MPVTRAGYVHCSILFSIPSYHSIFQFSIYRCPNFSSHFCLLLTFCDTVYSHFNIQQRHKQFCHYRKGLAVLSSEWLPVTLVAEKLRRQCIWEIYMNIRANYISNLSPNHSLQLTTWTSVRESLQVHLKIMTKLATHRCSVVTISARSNGCYCMFFDRSRCDSFLSGYQLQDPGGRYGLWRFLSGCLIQLAIHNLTNVSLTCLQLG